MAPPPKVKIAVFDLTDCEGCESVFLEFEGRLLALLDKIEIKNWRLIDSDIQDDFDVAFVEGSPISEEDKEILRDVRKKSKVLIALGACAATGGVVASRPEGALDYEGASGPAKPLSAFVDVDLNIPGCPVNAAELETIVTLLLAGGTPKTKEYPVCLECKAASNPCLLISGEPCLGPVTAGGCGAACPSSGIRCLGCWGLSQAPNLPALNKILEDKGFTAADIDRLLGLFFRELPAYKEFSSKGSNN